MGFAKSLEALAEKAKGNVETAVKQAMFLMAQQLVQGSPVDEGRFRGNWQFGVAAINYAADSPPDLSGTATLARIKGQIDSLMKMGGVYYVTNSLPYAMRIERGWSQQAPYGVVRLAVQALPGAINSYVRGELS